jgi:hypothetical protein
MNQKSFYAYLLLDPTKSGDFVFTLPDGYGLALTFEPIYAGKGKGLRAQSHIKEAIYGKTRKHQNRHKLNRIQQILSAGFEPLCFLVKSSLSESEAFALERDLIQTIGRRDLKTGTLTNWSDGGEGVANISEATRELHVKAQTRFRAQMTLAENIYLSLSISEAVTRAWNELPEDAKLKHASKNKVHWDSLSDEQKVKAMKGFRSGYRKWLASLDAQERKDILGAGSKAWWASLTEEQHAAHVQKATAGLKRTLASRSEDDWAVIKKNQRAAQNKRIADMSQAERKALSDKKSADNAAFLESLTEEQRKAHFAKAREGQKRASVQCPHCPVFHMNKAMMAKYHFENCKHKR